MEHVSKTLLEQLQITDFEVTRRKELVSFTAADAELLGSLKELVVSCIDQIVTAFYLKQTQIEEISLLIGDADTLKRLHLAQRHYTLGMFDGIYNLDYVNNRLRIGMVHKRIGVEPKLYLSAVKTLRDTILEVLGHHIADQSRLKMIADAIDKLLNFDTALVFDTYIRGLVSEVESAKNKAVGYAQILEAKVAERTSQLHDLSQRDSLTGLFNQRALREFMLRELLVAQRNATCFSLVYFDIDGFKLVNDSRGHMAGDDVLVIVADCMKMICRSIDFPCRHGGDEFCIALPSCTIEEAERVGQRLIECFAANVPDISLSIGLAETGPVDFVTIDDLLRMADGKMYEAKSCSGFKICK